MHNSPIAFDSKHTFANEPEQETRSSHRLQEWLAQEETKKKGFATDPGLQYATESVRAIGTIDGRIDRV